MGVLFYLIFSIGFIWIFTSAAYLPAQNIGSARKYDYDEDKKMETSNRRREIGHTAGKHPSLMDLVKEIQIRKRSIDKKEDSDLDSSSFTASEEFTLEKDNQEKPEDSPELFPDTKNWKPDDNDISLDEEFSNISNSTRTSSSNTTGKPHRKKQLLIGYLTGLPFGGLADNILRSIPKTSMFNSDAAYTDGPNAALPDIPYSRGRRSSGPVGRRRRFAEPYPDPKPDPYAYPDPDADPYPDAYPDAMPLEKLQVIGTNKTILLTDLALIFQKTDVIGTSKFLQGHQISGAMRYALEVVNNDPRLLPDYELTFRFYNTKGIPTESVKAVMELWRDGAVAFIGPEDSCQTEAMIAAAVNLPMISYKCADNTVSDKTKYSTFVRTVPADGEVSKATVGLLKQFRWNKFTMVHQDDNLHEQIARDIVKLVEKYPNMDIINTTAYAKNFNIDGKSSLAQVKDIVYETYQNTRIYVVLGDQGFVQLMLLEMHELNLFAKGEYAVVYVDFTYTYMNPDDAAINRYFRPTIYTIQKGDHVMNKQSRQLMEISRALFVVIPTPVSFNNSKYSHFWQKVVKYNQEDPFRVYRAYGSQHYLNTEKPLPNRYASYLFDAVLLYARALHESLESKANFTNGTAIIKRLLGRKYRSMQGFDVKINEQGDAMGNFTLLTRQKLNSSYYNLTYSMVPSGIFVDAEEGDDDVPALRLHDGLTIDWVNGVPPDDEPECGFHREKCIQARTRTAEIVGGLAAVFVIVAILIGFMVHRNRKIEKELAGLIWKIEPKEIQFISRDGHSADLGASRLTLGSQESDYGTGLFSAIDMHCLAKYKGALVAIKEIQYGRRLKEITRATKMEMKKMRALHHDNINNFMGIIVKPELIYVVREYCAKGSLFDVLLNEDFKLDELFTASFVDDLIKAMTYLHESELRVHGNLKSTNCVITSRWSLQVSDYGLHELREGQIFEDENQRYRALLWTAPELLLSGAIEKPQRGSQKADIFSFGIILHEIFTRTGPYGIESAMRYLSPRDVYMLIIKTRQNREMPDIVEKNEAELQMLGLVNMNQPYLPSLDDLVCQNYVKEALCQCWEERSEQRPDFRAVRQKLKPLFKGILRRNIMDHMMAMMEKHQNNLEQLVDERTMALNEEKKRVETLLHRMLPDMVAGQLMRGEDVVPESYDAVTIYFSDIVGFTSLSAESTPLEVVSFLNALYTLFDGIIRRYDVYKVETIGDAYMVVSGLPTRNDNHAGEIGTMALHLLKAVDTFQIPHRQDKKLLLRIGIHTGPCVAGVVGKTMPRYCLFGDTVNTASRMESNGVALKIHCSEFTKKALDALGGYIVEERGLVPMKGKGEMLTYWLMAKQEFVMASPVNEEVPLFQTGAVTVKPPTANVHRRKGGAESLLHLPTRGDSLQAIPRRNTGQPKLLQPAPAFSSTAAKPGVSTGVAGGSGSTRNSRILTTVHAPEPASASVSNNNRPFDNTNQQHRPTASMSVQRPFDPRRPRSSSNKRGKGPEHNLVLTKASSGGNDSTDPFANRLHRQLSVETEDMPDGLRKRSMSYPSNVEALIEQMANLGVSRDLVLAQLRDQQSGHVSTALSSSSATTSASQTPHHRRSRSVVGHYTKRDRPSSQPLMSEDSIGSSTYASLSNNNSKRNTPRKERFREHNEQNEKSPYLTAPQSMTSSRSSMKINCDNEEDKAMLHDRLLDDYESDSEESPVPRKRSLSCGDAMVSNGPVVHSTKMSNGTPTTSAVTSSDPQHITSTRPSALYFDQTNHVPSGGTSTQSTNSAGTISTFSARSAPVTGEFVIPINKDRRRQAHGEPPPPYGQFADANPMDRDDSPLLTRTTAVGTDGGKGRMWKERKSAGSLQPLFTPGHRGSSDLDVDSGNSSGSGTRLGRVLRYLKRPLSHDRLRMNECEKRLKGQQNEPSIV